MATFPLLGTGAVTQYPAPLTSGQGVQIIRFLDATDQRYITQPAMLRQWQIRLDLLTDSEIQQIQNFFTSLSGDYSPFTFPDPFSGTAVPNCRLGSPGLVSEYLGVGVSSTSLWVIETYA